MPKHHSPEQKAQAFECLRKNGGSIAAASEQLGIPERTLYAWRREFWKQQVLQRQPIFESPQYFDTDDLDKRLFLLRNKVLRASDYLLDVINSGVAPLMLDKIRAQVGLVDIVMKLDAYLKPHRPDLYPEE